MLAERTRTMSLCPINSRQRALCLPLSQALSHSELHLWLGRHSVGTSTWCVAGASQPRTLPGRGRASQPILRQCNVLLHERRREDLSDDESQKAGLAFNHQTRAPRYSSATRMAFLSAWMNGTLPPHRSRGASMKNSHSVCCRHSLGSVGTRVAR